jgi:glycerol uptake operon antiterminator
MIENNTVVVQDPIHQFIEIIQKQICIPVVASMKQVELFLKTDLQICVLQNIHISLLGHMISLLHEQGRKALVHIDMINGIAADEYGTEHLCQKLKCDGIITSKTRIIETTKKNKKIAIQRMFLIDSKSVERGIETIKKSNPDIVEVMPAIAYNIIPFIKEHVGMPIIGGGLLKSEKDIIQGLNVGCTAFTVSDLDLCVQIFKKE